MEPRKLVASCHLQRWGGVSYLLIFVGEGSQESGMEWSFEIFARTYIQCCKSLLFIGLVAF
jgi:hypothetical protein